MNLKTPVALRNALYVVLAASLIATACHKNETPAPSPESSAAKKPGIISAEKTSFDEVTAKLNPGGNLFAYLDTDQILRGLSNRISATSNFVTSLPTIPSDQRDHAAQIFGALDGLAHNSGIDEISGLGMSSIAREPGFYFGKLVVYHYPGQNHGVLWSLFGAAPHPLDTDLLPDTTAMAFFSDFDLQMAWTNTNRLLSGLDIPGFADVLNKAPQQFQQQTGLPLNDVLASLAGDYGFLFTLDEHQKVTLPIPGHSVEMPNPGIAFIIKVKNDLIFNRVDQALTNSPVIAAMLTSVDDTDLKMRTVKVPLPIPLDVRPTIARSGDYLIVASTDSLVRDMLAVKSGKTKGFTSTDDFKKLSQDIPGDGNNFALLTRAFSRTAFRIGQQFTPNDATADAREKLFNTDTNSFSYSVGVNGADGWEGFANGNHNFQAMVVPAAAAIGAGAAIAIPNFVKARQAAQQNQTTITNTP